MISCLTGAVIHKDLSSITVDVHGVGFLVNVPTSVLSQTVVGDRITVHTTLVVREDSLTLFGFSDADDREVFLILQTAKGVGPKVALAMISSLGAEGIRVAVARQDAAALQRVNGIGKKGAQQIILDMGTKLGPPLGTGTGTAGSDGEGGAQAMSGPTHADLIEALTRLGWNERDAANALDQVGIVDGDLGKTLKAALVVLGRR